jgi:hypothetical protein
MVCKIGCSCGSGRGQCYAFRRPDPGPISAARGGCVVGCAARWLCRDHLAGSRLALRSAAGTSSPPAGGNPQSIGHNRSGTTTCRARQTTGARAATVSQRKNPLPSPERSVPVTTATGGVVHGPTRAQLDPAHAQRIIGITDAGDRGLIALNACQAYVHTILERIDE